MSTILLGAGAVLMLVLYLVRRRKRLSSED
jgi:LPXTG-motif cell wall-anchored protein